MTDLFTGAWQGWGRFISDGKLAAAFFAALLFLWLCRGREVNRTFLLYASVTAACCVLPFTAAFLMLYQTRFYDYVWIWSLVPLTAVTAYGFAELLAGFGKDSRDRLPQRGLKAALLLTGMLVLCGNLGGMPDDGIGDAAERKRVQVLLERLEEMTGDIRLCLWAPENVLEYVRELNGKIQLPYGRNMWDQTLNAYTYDVYDQATVDLYRWMDRLDMEDWEKDLSEELSVTAAQCVETARSKGVNCILLPEVTAQESVEELEQALGVQAERLEGYYLFWPGDWIQVRRK